LNQTTDGGDIDYLSTKSCFDIYKMRIGVLWIGTDTSIKSYGVKFIDFFFND
jgi:hypothetical protein